MSISAALYHLAEAVKTVEEALQKIVDKIVESIDFNGILDAIRLYTDSPVPRSKPRPPREIFPRGHYMVDKRDDIRRRLRCVKVARQY